MIMLGKKTPKKTTPREQMRTEKKISDPKYRTKEIVQQELTSKIQNYQETFNSAEQNNWENEVSTLIEELKSF
jgi:hypothetical protein